MINQDIFNLDYNTDDDTNSSNSSKSSNSSNYTITSDPINYYRKDVLKQMTIQSKSKPLSPRQQQTQTQLKLYRNKINYYRDENNSDENPILCREIGYISGFDKNTPLINYLINKRINFCEMGASSHIAAFVPVLNNYRCCFLRKGKWKSCYG